MSAITLERVTKRYDNGVTAVDAIDLEIRDGEFMILLGPSGCGKSTTLRMIAGLETITEGRLFIDGAPMHDVDPAKRDLAIVFQNYALYPHMSVRKNLAFGLELRKTPRPEIQRRVAAIADMLGIEPLLDRRPGQLSGGQRQRVAVGRALVREPKAFLLDEPLSNLDAKLRAQMRTELVRLHRRLATTIVHVTHDQVEAMTMGERICIMRDGAVVQVGAPLEVYRDPVDTFVAGFLASPPMNLVSAMLEATEGRPVVRLGRAVLPLPPAADLPPVGTSITVGIQPQDLSLEGDGVALPLLIDAVEALGPETILVGRLDGSVAELSARIGPDHGLTAGSTAALRVDPRRLYLFDGTSGRALARRARPGVG